MTGAQDASWLARLPEQTPDLVLRLGGDDRVLYMNPAARAEFAGELEVGSPAPPALRAGAAQARASGTVHHAEVPHGDRWFWLATTPDGDEANVYGRDVTERRRTEAAVELTTGRRDDRALREASERLQESLARYRTLVELAPDAVVVHQDREIVFANPAALRLYGAASLPELLGRDIVDLVHPEDRETIARRVAEAQHGARTPLREFRLLTLDGRTVYAEASGVGIPYQGQAAVQVLIRDVTERRRAQEALQRNREEYAHIVEGSGSVILRIDPEMRITYMNPHGLEFFGYSREEILGRRAVDTIVPARDDAGGDVAGMAEDVMLHPERYVANVNQNRRKDGSRVWMSWANKPIYDAAGALVELLVVGTDVSRLVEAERELQRRQEELRRSEERFRTLAQALPQIVFDLDPEAQGGYFNERWAEYTGAPPGDLEARGALVHPEDRERMLGRWFEAVRTGRPYECEYRFRRHDGEYRWFLGRAVPMRVGGDGPTRWLGTATDIHDLKLAQEALRVADQRKNEFLGILSHELRNPLAPIKNSLFILERAAPGGEQARRAQEVIGRQVDQLSRLVDDLLDVTRITRNKVRLQKRPLELNDLVRHTVEDHRTLFQKAGVDLRVEPAVAPILLEADWNRLSQVLGNLLQNAAKFTASGGRVVVSVSVDEAASRAVLEVADTGMGLAPEVAEHLFEPFVQADAALDHPKGGLGLGLALVKGLVELHGGDVSASSAGRGCGSAFTVRLPLAPAGRAEPPEAPAVTRGACPRVLVIEDNVDAADTLREALELGGHQVVVAYDGPEGLARARETRPDVVLCDIGLPGMSGYEVARAFRADEALRDVPLVALSGYALPEDLQRSAEAGFDRHMAKPPSIEKLEEMFASMAARDPLPRG